MKNYEALSPQGYLERTHDGAVYDIAFDGNTLLLVSESWVATDPLEPRAGQNFRVIFSRYRAAFTGVSDLALDVTDPEEFPGEPTLSNMMREEVRTVMLTPPSITIETDGHELCFRFKAVHIERFAPSLAGDK